MASGCFKRRASLDHNVLEASGDAPDRAQGPAAHVPLRVLLGLFDVREGRPVIGGLIREGIVIFVVVDGRLRGRIDLAVPAAQRMKGKGLARGHRGHGRHRDGGDRPRVQLRRGGAAIGPALSARGEDTWALRHRRERASRKIRRAQLPRQARRRGGQDGGVVGRDVILIGERADVLYAQQEDGHEEGRDGRGPVLKDPGVVLEVLAAVDHGFVCG